MPKKKAGSFNSTQIKDGKIVRMNKNGTIKSKIDTIYCKTYKER
jgi:hypothetical protein